MSITLHRYHRFLDGYLFRDIYRYYSYDIWMSKHKYLFFSGKDNKTLQISMISMQGSHSQMGVCPGRAGFADGQQVGFPNQLHLFIHI